MTNETLELLIIEDSKKHLIDAQTEIKSRIDLGANINVSYAQTLSQANSLIDNSNYSGIITDIFFPYDEISNSDTDSFPTGWENTTAHECFDELRNFGVNPPKFQRVNERQLEVIEAANRWLEGYEMHPSGILIADKAFGEYIPVVFCTDTYHHGFSTEPINQWARDKNIPLIDSSVDYYVPGESKPWDEACQQLYIEIFLKSKGIEGNQDRVMFRGKLLHKVPCELSDDFKDFQEAYAL